MAPPTIRSSSVVAGTSASLPSSTAVGDLIVLAQMLYSSSAATTATTPSGTGWTTIQNQIVVSGANGTRITYWWKVATVAGAQTYTATPVAAGNSSGVGGQYMMYAVISGADADPLDGTAFVASATAGPATITRATDDLLLGFWGGSNQGFGTGWSGAPTGMTSGGAAFGSFGAALMAYLSPLSGTSTGTKAATLSNGVSIASGLLVVTSQRLILKSGSVTTTLGAVSSPVGQKRSTATATSTLGAQPSTTASKAISRPLATTLALTTSATPVPHHYGTVASALALSWSAKRIFGTVQSLGLTSTVTGGRSARATAVSTLGLTSPATGVHLGQGAATSALGLFWNVPTHRKAGTGLTSSTLALNHRIDAYITGGEPPPDPSQEIQTRAYVPSQNAPVRFIVQDILTGEIRDWDFPLSEVEITFNLSGATSLRATLGPEYRELGETHLDAWASWIHVEEGGAIRASVIVQPMAVSDQDMDIEGIGFTGYPNGIPYQGELSLIEVDPIQVVRLIWVHLLSFPDAAIGITMDATASPITLGTPAVTVPVLKEDGTPAYDITTETDADGNVTETGRTAKTQDIEAKPYELNWYDDKDCGQEIDSLAKSTPFDFAERVTWNAARTAVLHHLMVGYPRLGTRRFDLRFAEDENLLQVVTALETPDHYASQVIVRGSGEGRDAIRGYAGSRDPRRLRRIATVVDKTLTDATVAAAMANEELRRRVSVTEFSDIVVDATHDNAPLGSWALGDDILVQCNIPYIGEVALWHRIVAFVWTPDSDVVTLNLKRSEQFAYGELGGAIGGSRGEEPQKDYVIGEDSTTNTTLPSTDDGTGTDTGGGTTTGGTVDTTTAAGKIGWGAIIEGDEFATDGTPDTAKWSLYDGPGHDGNGRRVPARATVTGGKLVLTGLANGDSAGMAHKLNQKYGRWEVRVRAVNTGTSNGNLYSPVLIIWPKSDKWPDDGEYDFYEPGQAGGTTAGAYIHYPSTTVQQEHATKTGVDLSQFHNFAIDWQATGIKGYIDGVEWFSYSSGGIQNMPSGHLTIQLDNFDGTSQTPATMEVEWVRIYSATGTGQSITPGTGTSTGGGGDTGGGSTGGSTGTATYPMDIVEKRWYLTTPEPDGSGVESIYRPALDTLVRESNTKRTFKLNAAKTGIIMTSDYGGAHTPNSTNVRMELREMALNSTGSGSKADWSTNSGTHTMEWEISVDRLDGNHCVIGQIHDADDDTSVFRLEGGTLYMTNNDDTHANTVLTGYTLGTKLTLKMVASGGKIDGYVNGVKKATVTRTVSGCYFKVGNYLQRKGASGSWTQITLYSCTVTHS